MQVSQQDTVRLRRDGVMLDGQSILAPGRIVPICIWCYEPQAPKSLYCADHLEAVRSPRGLDR